MNIGGVGVGGAGPVKGPDSEVKSQETTAMNPVKLEVKGAKGESTKNPAQLVLEANLLQGITNGQSKAQTDLPER